MGRDASRRRASALTVPFGRQGTGWEVAYAALLLISNKSSYVNAHLVPRRRPYRQDRADLACSNRITRGIAQSAVMPNCPHHPSFRKFLHEPDQTVRALQAWRNHAAQSPCHGAFNPQLCRPAWCRANSPLRPARLGRSSHYRGQPIRSRAKVSGHARHLFQEQVAGWRKVTDRVHEQGGRIFIQIWHVGRVSHNSLQPGGGKPVAPSAIRAKGKTFVNGTFADISEPRALALKFRDHRRFQARHRTWPPASTASKSTAPTLLDQFAKDGTNKRSTPVASRPARN